MAIHGAQVGKRPKKGLEDISTYGNLLDGYDRSGGAATASKG